MSRRLITILAFAASSACDGFMPSVPESPAAQLPSTHWGTVMWRDVTSSCPAANAWAGTESVMAMVEQDEVTLYFDSMPPLHGKLTEGRAAVAGEMTFPGDTGATVSCVVEGDTALVAGGLEGQVHERLASEGDLNCDSRGRYVIVFE